MKQTLRRCTPILVGLCATLLTAQSAWAIEVSQFDVTPDNTTAGAHSDVRVAIAFSNDRTDHIRSFKLHLAPGLVGNPNATSQCSEKKFRMDACDNETRVGSVKTHVTATKLGIPIDATGDVYNVEPLGSEPARLGIVVRPPLSFITGKIYLSSPVTLRPRDGGLDSAVFDLPTSVLGMETWIESMDMVLEGVPRRAIKPFMSNPTSCIPALSKIDATSYDEDAASASASSSFTPTDCNKIAFDPSTDVDLETTQRGRPSGYTISIGFPKAVKAREQAHLKRAEVVLPEGTTISPPVAHDLKQCTSDDFGDSESPVNCPKESQVGTVSYATPLIGTIHGPVFLGTPRPDTRYPLLVSIDEAGVRVKLIGKVSLNPSNGQITTVFDDLPQLPFTRFSLSFFGGNRGMLANPGDCGEHRATARLTPWSAAPAFDPSVEKTVVAGFTIDADGAGAKCAEREFKPKLAVEASNLKAGAPTGVFSTKITVPDGNRALSRVSIDMPPGLAGYVTRVKPCATDKAVLGQCGEESLVGTTTALTGTGPDPVALSGKVYVSGPIDGAPLGMVIVLPAKVGPMDLGTVVVKAPLRIRSADSGLTVTTERLPRFIQGVPVEMRELSLRLDRPGFLGNPTSCAPLQVSALLDSLNGAPATVSAGFQATQCDQLPYKPAIQGSLGGPGQVNRDANPAVQTVVTLPEGHAANKRVSVTLPSILGFNPDRLANLCSPEQLKAAACPQATQVGHATAQTPLLPMPLSGPVYMAQANRGEMPVMAMFLNGPISLQMNGKVDLTQDGLKTTFDNLPDVFLSRFELSMDGGSNSALALNKNLCDSGPALAKAEFVGHNGASAQATQALTISGCKPKPTAHGKIRGLKSGRPTLTVDVNSPEGAPSVRSVRISLPRLLRLSNTRRRGAFLAQADGRAVGTKSLRASTRAMAVDVGARGARQLTVTIPRGTLAFAARKMRALKQSQLTLGITIRDTDGRRSTALLRLAS